MSLHSAEGESPVSLDTVLETTKVLINDSYRFWFCIFNEPCQIFLACFYLALLFYDMDQDRLWIDGQPWCDFMEAKPDMSQVISLATEYCQIIEKLDTASDTDAALFTYAPDKKILLSPSLSNINDFEETAEQHKQTYQKMDENHQKSP